MYDIIVIGAGHAGIEAALAGARMNKNVALITSHLKSIAHLPCNPSIGGPAKGIVVREIDALGGEMGIAADKNHLQMKMLNTTKGSAVQSLRAQIDKLKYPKHMVNVLENNDNITLIEDDVNDLVVENNSIRGVICQNGGVINSKAVVITSGTYLNACKLVSDQKIIEGPDGYKSISKLSDRLKELGFKIQRLKTGTPARVDINSVNYDVVQKEIGTNRPLAFSESTSEYLAIDNQWPCYLTYTNVNTHDIINSNLQRSSMYSGLVEGVGPRYCPSIEDKLVRFSDKDRHQIFLEPEASDLNTIYVQGFSTSMPEDVQKQMIESIVGLENAKIIHYGYAIEYDAIDARQLKLSLESKLVNNLFFAGQINGTSGYEEAAGQGLIAGINASLKIDNKEPFILKRSDAYIGVMIDDLVTKGTNEPYRLLTSRAEYRLLLRSDNAPFRLTKLGYDIGVVSQKQYNNFLNIQDEIKELKEELNMQRFSPKHKINDELEIIGSSKLWEGISALELLKRPEVNIDFILKYLDNSNYSEKAKKSVEVEVKYEGYITKAKKQAEKFVKLENKKIPEKIDYSKVGNLALEAQQKLEEIRPASIGQAQRISGINPSDIQNLLMYIKKGVE